ncbi:hypothetical protein BDV06DRAFT_205373 [Aspergillus oleicola]
MNISVSLHTSIVGIPVALFLSTVLSRPRLHCYGRYELSCLPFLCSRLMVPGYRRKERSTAGDGRSYSFCPCFGSDDAYSRCISGLGLSEFSTSR